jgi:hypothetical protein
VSFIFTVGADGAERVVPAGGDLQAALNAAQPGDVILLQPGATYRGNYVLPVKSGDAVITLRSATPDAQLPAPGVRMTPAYVSQLATIASPNSSAALRTAAGAHHWRLLFLHFPSTHLGYNDIVRIGDGSSAQSAIAHVPYEIEVDRVFIHGHPLYGQKRGIALNGRAIAIRNSWISDIKAVGIDTQAIGGWNGPGPYVIENNYLEASGENFLLGGADPAIPNLVAEDVIVRHNYMSRPMTWRAPVVAAPIDITAAAQSGGTLAAGTYTYRIVARRPAGGGAIARSTASTDVSVSSGGGSVVLSWAPIADATEYRVYGRTPGAPDQYWTTTTTTFTDSGVAGVAGVVPVTPGDTWQVKNIFELKNARRVLVEYNVFENNWENAQPGYAILFTPRNSNGTCTWCVVEDVTFQYNIVRHTAAGINLTGYDDYPRVTAQTARVRIRHNLFYGITRALGGSGWFLLVGHQPRALVIDHNTIDFDGTTAVYAYGGSATAPEQILGFEFTNNAVRHNAYGINAAGHAYGLTALGAYFPAAVVAGNWLQGGSASRYPQGNLFVGAFEAAFLDAGRANYEPASGSILINQATDGSNIGADVRQVLRGVHGVAEGNPASTPKAPRNVRIVGGSVPRLP